MYLISIRIFQKLYYKIELTIIRTYNYYKDTHNRFDVKINLKIFPNIAKTL